jgi:hypothetical protein
MPERIRIVCVMAFTVSACSQVAAAEAVPTRVAAVEEAAAHRRPRQVRIHR